ncbi:hypothetical protein ACFE04_031612 [Oxalis oulophora]
METDQPEILSPYELSYSDLLLLSSSDNEKLESMRTTVMQNLGPNGPGLLSITDDVTNSSVHRKTLLPLARYLALINTHQRNQVLKEHILGSDVSLKNPDRKVSSFAMQLKYSDVYDSSRSCMDFDTEDVDDDQFKRLGNGFRELGYCMMNIGLCLARVCDKAIGGNELEQSLLESGSAKGRLIHYHSLQDMIVLKEAGRHGLGKGHVNHEMKQCRGLKSGNEGGSSGIHDNLWQEWHYDYGVFTVLTDPMFILGDLEHPSPSGHSYLQIFDPSKNKLFNVKTSPGSFIVQVGESADILSKGRLRSTLHSVCRPEKLDNLSRETFVVFLQPSWSKTFDLSNYIKGCDNQGNCITEKGDVKLSDEIKKIVPPLLSRLKDGMTFAEFSRETTKQYYGGGGLQANRK